MKKLNKKMLSISVTIFLFSFFIGPVVSAVNIKPELQVNFGDRAINFQSVNCSNDGTDCSIGWIGQYVGALYNYGVGLAVILAIVMIMVGGFIWILSGGSPDRVSTAKSFIGSSLTGLTLALFSFVILQSLNPNLVNFSSLNIASPEEQELAQVQTVSCCVCKSWSSAGTSSTSCTAGLTNEACSDKTSSSVGQGGGSGTTCTFSLTACSTNPSCEQQYVPPGTGSGSILDSAQDAIGQPLGVCDATSGGRLGCALAVNTIVENALGYPVGGGLSTQAMYDSLLTSSNFSPIQGVQAVQPGDIIITPGGHVGICETSGCGSIISNSSSQLTVQRNFSYDSWLRTYGNNTFFFRHK